MTTRNLVKVVNFNYGEEKVKKQARLDYFLLETEILTPELKVSTVVYGIELVMQHLLQKEDESFEQAAIQDICCSKSDVLALIDTMARNTVTPTTFYDVVNDYILSDDDFTFLENFV